MDIISAIRHNVGVFGMARAGDTIVVAVSGGPDSLCLLHALAHLRRELGITLHVAHLDHGLRGREGSSDAHFVRETAAEWGIDATAEQADVAAYRAEHRLTLEEAARQVRYDFLARVAGATGAAAVAVAHTADDQAETIIMHLLRGAGLAGLTGMLPVSTQNGESTIIRPLLDVWRRDVEAYCAANGLQPRRDRSNSDQRLWRNRVRLEILPYLEQASPGLRTNLLHTAAAVAGDNAYLDDVVQSIARRMLTAADGGVTLSTAAWRDLPVALQRRLLRESWRQATGSRQDLSWAHTEALRRLAGGEGEGQLHLPGGLRAQRSYGAVHLSRRTSLPAPRNLPQLEVEDLPLATPGLTPLPGGTWQVEVAPSQPSQCFTLPVGALCQCIPVAAVQGGLQLRRAWPGERMQPFGMAGSKKIHDIMIDAKIERRWRAGVPLLVSGATALWLVGVCTGEAARVTPRDEAALLVSFRRVAG